MTKLGKSLTSLGYIQQKNKRSYSQKHLAVPELSGI